jgi:hypothetical protein
VIRTARGRYRTYCIEQCSPGFWVVTDPNDGDRCLGVLTTRAEARHFVDELMAAAGRGIAQAMRNLRSRPAVSGPTCECMVEPDVDGAERVVTHSGGCPEFLGY